MRRSLKYGVLVLLLGVTACRPKSVLAPNRMVDILCDLHRTEAVLQVAGYNYGHDEAVNKAYRIVMDRHGVTQAQFDSSWVWYMRHPNQAERLYPKVVERLEKEEKDWLAAHPANPELSLPPRVLPPLTDVFHWWLYGLQVMPTDTIDGTNK